MRSVIVRGDVGLIPLTRGYEAVIDSEDVSAVGAYIWTAMPRSNGLVYARRSAIGPGGRYRTIYLHRQILGLQDTGTPFVDHRNGDPLDCRRQNLRTASRSQNSANRRLGTNSSGHIGVTWFSRTRRWRVTVADVHVGYFTDLSAALKARDEAHRLHLGEFSPIASRTDREGPE